MNGEESTEGQRGTSLTGCKGQNEDSWISVWGIKYLDKDEKHLKNDSVRSKNVLS